MHYFFLGGGGITQPLETKKYNAFFQDKKTPNLLRQKQITLSLGIGLLLSKIEEKC